MACSSLILQHVLTPHGETGVQMLAERGDATAASHLEAAVFHFGKGRHDRALTAATRVIDAGYRVQRDHGFWPAGWREAMTLSFAVAGGVHAARAALDDAFRAFDTAIILGGPSEALRAAIALVEKDEQHVPGRDPRLQVLQPSLAPESLAGLQSFDVPRIAVYDSAAAFATAACWGKQTAAIVSDGGAWATAARAAFCNLPELLSQYGHRYVPVEVGVWPTVEEHILPLSRFLCDYITDMQGVAYLAQHGLFEQFAELATHVPSPADLLPAVGEFYVV